MPNYSKSKIYKIYSYENDDVYYGSTVDTLSRRMTGHRTHYKMYKEGKMNYLTSFKILELTSCKIELVENYPCNSKEELLQREGFYIRNNDCVNKIIAGRTKKEYYETNIDKIKIYQKEVNKEYHEQNKDKIKEQKKEYYEENKEYKKQQSKAYYEQNKEYRKQQMIEYRQRKKEQQQLILEDTNINKI